MLTNMCEILTSQDLEMLYVHVAFLANKEMLGNLEKNIEIQNDSVPQPQ